MSAKRHNSNTDILPPDFEAALPPGDLLPARYVDRKLVIRGWSVLLLNGFSGLALTLCFNVPGLSWLAFFALVPWVVASAAAASIIWAMLGSFLLGLGFWLVNVYWVIPITVPGYLGMCVYLAAYSLLGGWLVRHCYQQRRMPFFIVLPIIYVGLELLRNHVITGFGWLLLGHSQYRWTRLIQIADLVGAYGVSFLVAMTNGIIADLLLQPLFLRTRKGSKPSVVAVGVVVLIGLGVFAMVYGTVQMSFGQFRDGPKVTVIQENFPIGFTRESANDRETFEAYRRLTIQAQQQYRADLMVWPESMAQPFLYSVVTEQPASEDKKAVFATLVDGEIINIVTSDPAGFRDAEYVQTELPNLARQLECYMVVGSSTRLFYSLPNNSKIDAMQRNSAFMCTPEGQISHRRYDKTHLVPFGEYIPFRKSIPAFYHFILSISPYGGFDHTIEHGSGPEVFAFTTANGQSFRFTTPICYEGTVPDLCRQFVLPKPEPKVDFLVNISNDGWFNASWELEQHLMCYVFRAVENRVPVARAVNTGISGFVDSSGRLHGLVSKDGRTRGVAGFSSAQLRLDPRISLYSRTGGIFALLCGLGSLVLFVDSMIAPWKRRWSRVLLILIVTVMLADALGRWLI